EIVNFQSGDLFFPGIDQPRVINGDPGAGLKGHCSEQNRQLCFHEDSLVVSSLTGKLFLHTGKSGRRIAVAGIGVGFVP
ncbi:hypothetical protein, partial [Klebsiella pneumoniae]|uniref:hypothetical protein n=1 Tax=Klebsiella pneumoniae TaxID=573 RepID=UPI00272F2B87